MRKIDQLRHIKRQTAEKAYRELMLNFKLLYVLNENSLCFIGFDISTLSKEKPVAEVILKEGKAVQVRHLREKPFVKKTEDFKIGGF